MKRTKTSKNRSRGYSSQIDIMAKRHNRMVRFDNNIFLQPWFLPAQTYIEIRRLVPNIHLFKMRYYYEDWGCLRCGTRENRYVANGLCKVCSGVIRGRIVTSLRRRLRQAGLPTDYKPTATFMNSIIGTKSKHR